jgi:hypothetical protein
LVESKKVTGPHEDLTYRIIGAAMAVHRRLGPGHREVIYQRALEEELSKAGIAFEAEKSLPVCDGERSLRPGRVFPSPHASDLAQSHQWLFVPDRLKRD